MVDSANTIWRDFVTEGVPTSGMHEPRKAKIRDWGRYLESLTQAAGYGNTVWFATKALLDADLAHAAGTPAVVYADTTAANNGIYIKSGASGAGSWGQILTYLPGYQFVVATNAGEGSENAIVASSSPRVAYTDGVQLIRLNITDTNTSADVLVTFDGGAGLAIKVASGNKPAIGGLTAGMSVLGFVDQGATVFTLVSDQAATAVQTAAEAAQAAAETAQAAAEAAADLAQGVSVAIPVVHSHAALKLVDTVENTEAILSLNGKQVVARWDSSIQPGMDTVDPDEIKFVQPNPAASGAWILPFEKKQVGVLQQIKYRLETGRVDFPMVGDSNQAFQGYGNDHGLAYALDDAGYPMYATGLLSINENNADGAGLGYFYAYNAAQPLLGATSGAPLALDDYLDKGAGGLGPHQYGYLASGTFSNGNNSGMSISVGSPLRPDINNLRYHLHYGTVDSGSGSFRISWRNGGPSYTQQSESALVTTNTGSFGIEIATVDLNANPAFASIAVQARLTSTTDGITGPYFGLWQRVEAPGVATGYSVHTLDAHGGGSARTIAYDLQQMSATAKAYFMDECARLQGARKTIACVISLGANDRSASGSLPSLGPAAIEDEDSAAAYVDNHRAIITELTDAYSGDERDLFFLIVPTHPIASTPDVELEAYRSAIEVLEHYVPRCQVINTRELTSYAEILAAGGYASGGSDTNHLVQAGSEFVWPKILEAVL